MELAVHSAGVEHSEIRHHPTVGHVVRKSRHPGLT